VLLIPNVFYSDSGFHISYHSESRSTRILGQVKIKIQDIRVSKVYRSYCANRDNFPQTYIIGIKCIQFFPVLWIRIGLIWIRIRIGNMDPDPGGPKWPTKVKKSSFQVRDVLYGGLKASPVA
jgi:hypothetical protein